MSEGALGTELRCALKQRIPTSEEVLSGQYRQVQAAIDAEVSKCKADAREAAAKADTAIPAPPLDPATLPPPPGFIRLGSGMLVREYVAPPDDPWLPLIWISIILAAAAVAVWLWKRRATPLKMAKGAARLTARKITAAAAEVKETLLREADR